MKITQITEGMRLTFARSIFANEVGGKVSNIYKFSDPDGEHSGKSGWSWGICQFDINNNPNATVILRECGFTDAEIEALKSQTVSDMAPMNQKLVDAKSVVDRWDGKQLDECLTWMMTLCNRINVEFSNEEAFIHAADYENQFHARYGGTFYTFAKNCASPISAEMIRDFKYILPWGIKQLAKKDPKKDDVLRRYNNIKSIYEREA